MKNKNEYWQDIEKKESDPADLQSEFSAEEISFDIGSIKKSRRNFLQVMGFSFGALPLVSSCMRIPVKKALPYLWKSEQIIPGVANWYATSMDPLHGSSLLVKTREGRPIKIEGNPLSQATLGGTMATDQASILSLYDSYRYKQPQKNSQQVNWLLVDLEIKLKLQELSQQGLPITLITEPLSGPSSLRVIKKLQEKFPSLEHIVYQPNDMQSIVRANEECFDISAHAKYSIDKAKLILSFSADFLGTWISPVEFTKQYAKGRDLINNKTMSQHIQFESLMTLTGSNADHRHTVSPQEEAAFMVNLLVYLQEKKGANYFPVGEKLPKTNFSLVSKIGDQLLGNQGQSLVLCGSHRKEDQILVNAINHLLGNYGKTIEVYKRPYSVAADNLALQRLIEQKSKGAALFWNVNPAYDYADAASFESFFKALSLSVSFNSAPDETSLLCQYVLPQNHYLESWNDYINSADQLLLAQPVMQPLFATRMAQESLLRLMGDKTDYYDFIKETVRTEFFKYQQQHALFLNFWQQTVHDGVANIRLKRSPGSQFKKSAARSAYQYYTKKKYTTSGLQLVTYKKIAIGLGKMANNPWLQELPDPITKATWDNYFLISKKLADAKGLKTGHIIKVVNKDYSLELPALVQPGMSENILAVALGYGHRIGGKVAKNLGGNAFPFGEQTNVEIKVTNKFKELALTQTHHSMEGRDIVRETTLKDWQNDPQAGNKAPIKLISLWPEHDKSGEQWGMAIDLNKCTGCSGCIISCNAENNVPVVGRSEVKLRREMHWLRIDRYYKGDDENPAVVHQPLMCQHCDNAPCETVCPVLATVQSSDGLNQQVYNRCVGTRYCANNCPYKVRRFNWFDYPHNDKYENMVLNPDVVVRSRGVMEKCSLCIQRIQEGRLKAKKAGRPFKDGDTKLACQQSCPGDAIVFGNLNDAKSDIRKILFNARNYKLLAELNVQPRISYLTKVRNKG